MALPPSGPITMGMINTELGYPATQIISLNDASVRALAQVPAGMISLSNFYGKSNITPAGYVMGGVAIPNTSYINSIYELNFSNETGSIIATTTPNGGRMGQMGSTTTKGVTNRAPTPAISQFFPFAFSSKTFTAGSTFPNIYSNTTALGNNRAQTPDMLYAFEGGATPPGSFLSKYNLATDSVVFKSSLYASLAPGPQNNYASTVTSWTAWKNYSRGFAARNYRQHKIIYPTDTASVSAQNTLFELGSGPVNTTYAPYASFQSAENGFTYSNWIGTGATITNQMGRINFSTETWTRSFQAQTYVIGATTFQTPTDGYIVGGRLAPGGVISPTPSTGQILKYNFGTQTVSTLPITMPARVAANTTVQSAPVFG